MAEQSHLSYSQINQFLRVCPLQYAFQRIVKLKPEFVSESMPFGSAIHRAAEYFWAHRMDGKDVTADDLAELFAEVWKREVADTQNLQYQKTDFDSLLQQGRELIRVYRQSFPDDAQVVGFNVPFKVPLVDRDGEVLEEPLVGELDLLVKHGDRLCAVDLKTAAQRYSEGKIACDLQPTVYLYALRMLGREDILFRWDVLLKNKTPVLVQYHAQRTDEDYHQLIDLVKLMQSMIASQHFLPNHGSYFCAGCGYQAACRECRFNKQAFPAASMTQGRSELPVAVGAVH